MLAMEDDVTNTFTAYNDFYGMSRVINDMQHAIKIHDPDYSGSLSIGADIGFHDPLIFEWAGMRWTPNLILERLSWLLLASGLATVAALPFDRFDPAKRRVRRRKLRKRATQDKNVALSEWPTSIVPITTLTPLPNRRARGRIFAVLLAELRLMLRGQPWWWYGIALGLVIANAVTPPDVATILLAFAWLWPILIWSKMGARERRHFTHELVFSVAHPVRRQLSATWLSGVTVALLMVSGGLLNAITTNAHTHIALMAAGICFVPSLALALGVWSHSPRLFEVVYLMLWYIAFNGVSALDFMGISSAVIPPRSVYIYSGLAFILFIAAIFGRHQELQR
jgi:hypothetical protein